MTSTPLPPPPPPPPPTGSNVLRLSANRIAASITLLNPQLTLDTMGNSPVRYGNPHQIAVWPNQEIREQLIAECYADYSGSNLFTCLQGVNEEYPNISELVWVSDAFHSYIDFSSAAESYGAQDVLIPLGTTYKDTSLGMLAFDVNWVRNDNSSPITVTVSATPNDPEPTATFSVRLTSNHPTIRCESYLGCPDVDLTNMRVSAQLRSIGPGATAGRLSYNSPNVMFTFDRNLTGIPDAIVTSLVDIDAKIRDGVATKLEAALSTTARAAFETALTKMAIEEARLVHPTITGFSRIRQTWYDAGQIVVAYDWY